MKRIPFRDLHPTTRRLLLARALRSIGQGVLVVDFSLYLNALGWSGTAIGILLTGAGLVGAALALLLGPVSDRLQRKPFLLLYEALSLFCSLVALLSAHPWAISVAAVVGGFGRGASGAAGPFSPVEQAWLAEEVAKERRGWVYSLNLALGLGGMSLGALLAILPSIWNQAFPGPLAYRPLFVLVALTAIANLVVLVPAGERHRQPVRAEKKQAQQQTGENRRRENRILGQLTVINGFNGLAVGLTGPLISYWFALRFHLGPSTIAPFLAATFFLTAVSSLLTGRWTQRIGLIRPLIWTRLAGVVLLVLLPLAPTYWLASLAYLLRSVLNRSSGGARQALAVSLVQDERRGLAASLNQTSFQLPQAVGPSLAGLLLDAGQFSLPFYAAAFLQTVYLVAYGIIFAPYDRL